MLEIAQTLLKTKPADEVMKMLMNAGLTSLEAATVLCEALKAPSKIQMQKITILWSEGLADENLEFTSWQEINSLLWTIAQEHDKDGYTGAYAKTKFQLTWADGNTYSGRLDINTKGDYNIGESILSELKFYAGQYCPDHMTPERYEAFLNESNTSRQEYIDYINTYDIVTK